MKYYIIRVNNQTAPDHIYVKTNMDRNKFTMTYIENATPFNSRNDANECKRIRMKQRTSCNDWWSNAVVVSEAELVAMLI
jgi:hypothetical protein